MSLALMTTYISYSFIVLIGKNINIQIKDFFVPYLQLFSFLKYPLNILLLTIKKYYNNPIAYEVILSIFNPKNISFIYTYSNINYNYYVMIGLYLFLILNLYVITLFKKY